MVAEDYEWNFLNPLLFMSKAVLPTHFGFISVPFFTKFFNFLFICNNVFHDFRILANTLVPDASFAIDDQRNIANPSDANNASRW
jgi:hypothetical protein